MKSDYRIQPGLRISLSDWLKNSESWNTGKKREYVRFHCTDRWSKNTELFVTPSNSYMGRRWVRELELNDTVFKKCDSWFIISDKVMRGDKLRCIFGCEYKNVFEIQIYKILICYPVISVSSLTVNIVI